MRKVLVILPESIVGELIMTGFAHGFEMLGCQVVRKEIDEISEDSLKKIKPDIIFGYNYSFLVSKKCSEVIKRSSCKNIIFYFGDNPNSVDTKRRFLHKKLDEYNPTIFMWDRNYVNKFSKCFYLPLAVDIKKYLSDFIGYKYPISLVCLYLSDERINYVCEIIKIFGSKLNIFCPEDVFNNSVELIKEKKLLQNFDLSIYEKCWRGFVEKEEDLSMIYNSSKINLNMNFENPTSLNYAVFAILASGGFLISNENEAIKEYFNQKHLDFFKNTADLVDKIAFYLDNLNVAQKMAQLGKFEVMEKHNFSARARHILKHCKNF